MEYDAEEEELKQILMEHNQNLQIQAGAKPTSIPQIESKKPAYNTQRVTDKADLPSVKASPKYLPKPKSLRKPSPPPMTQPKSSATLPKQKQTISDATTVRTRAASKKSSRSTRKVNSTFGVDLSKVYSFDQPDEVPGNSEKKMTRKLQKEYTDKKLKELKDIYKSNNELAGRLSELIKM